MLKAIRYNLVACLILLIIASYGVYKDKKYKDLTMGTLVGFLGATLLIYSNVCE
ncbi:MAG: hypothetical protein ACLT9V_03295 [Anaerococcus obesiensis]